MSNSIRVLHVDDDPEFADLTAQFLRRESDRFEICTEIRGEDALDRLEDPSQEIHCLVADYILPDTNGLELLETIQNSYPELPFILFTGKGSEEVASDALSGGATDYLQKQSGTQQYELLANRIRNAVETARDITARREREREREATIQFLRDLYRVTTDPEQSFEQKVERLLQIGCETLHLSEGYLTRIDSPAESPGQRTQTVVDVSETSELSESGDDYELSKTYCRMTVESDGLLSISETVQEGWEGDPAQEEFDFGSYIGGKVVIDGDLYGTLYFGSQTARTEPFSDTERMFVRTMSKWLSYELERDQMTEELRRQNGRLEEFASVVSHDLRNPLNVIKGRLELAREDRDSDHLREASQALERSQELIEDLLALARKRNQEPTLDAVALGDTVERAWRNVATAGATLDVETERTIQADRSQLQQLLENLIRNSLEHGPAVEETVDGSGVTVSVGDLETGFYVADDGQGIPDGDREAVFESGVSTSENGTGVGLKIVAEIVDSHGWDIAVTESDDGGARFEIRGVVGGDSDSL
jgi:signal transduction histidine kinase/DNA-binding response OmpR family regulator